MSPLEQRVEGGAGFEPTAFGQCLPLRFLKRLPPILTRPDPAGHFAVNLYMTCTPSVSLSTQNRKCTS